jgi:hypothetical protein
VALNYLFVCFPTSEMCTHGSVTAVATNDLTLVLANRLLYIHQRSCFLDVGPACQACSRYEDLGPYWLPRWCDAGCGFFLRWCSHKCLRLCISETFYMCIFIIFMMQCVWNSWTTPSGLSSATLSARSVRVISLPFLRLSVRPAVFGKLSSSFLCSLREEEMY